MAAMQIWRHRPTGNHFAVYVEDGQVVRAVGPMDPKMAAGLTTRGFGDREAVPSLPDTLNTAPWEYDPVWQDSGHGEEDAEWLRGILEPGDDSMVGSGAQRSTRPNP